MQVLTLDWNGSVFLECKNDSGIYIFKTPLELIQAVQSCIAFSYTYTLNIKEHIVDFKFTQYLYNLSGF